MIYTNLYTSENYFNENEYAPLFAGWMTDTFESCSNFIQAQNYVPLGTPLGEGRSGRIYQLVDDEGGLSQRRDYGGTVDTKVVEGTPVPIYMGINSEKVFADYAQGDINGENEYRRQCEYALKRLARTMEYKCFNADMDAIDVTDKSGKKKYDYDGWAKFFKKHPERVKEVLYVGDIVKDVNMKYEADVYLAEANGAVSVDGENAHIIYCSEGANIKLAAIEANNQEYRGEYKFTNGIRTYKGIPKIVIRDANIPADWKEKGDFVLFVNQNEENGAHILVPKTSRNIVVRPDVNTGFGKETPIDEIFAPAYFNPKAACLCFLNGGEKPAEG